MLNPADRIVTQMPLERLWDDQGELTHVRGGCIGSERIRELLQGEQAPVPPRQKAIGSVEVCSHLMVADGIQVVIEPGRAAMSPEQVRSFIKGVMAVFALVISEEEAGSVPSHEQQRDLKGNKK